MTLSANGWVANDISLTANYTIGNGRTVRLRRGDAGYLLAHFADWFDKFVEDIDAGQPDDWGYAERLIRGSETTVSNHASGTAIDLNASKHPLGKRGTFTAAQTFKIRNQLKVYGGAIRWGGDYTGRPDEMHFEINANAATVGRVATNLRAAKVAADQPTYYDVTTALAKFAATTGNPKAAPIYQRARTIVGKLVRDKTSHRVPQTTADVLAVLVARRKATPVTAFWTRYRLAAVIRMLRPLA